MDESLKAKISGLPLTSGVYLMKDAAGVIIYVGKAVNLRRRVQSYFRGKTHHIKTDQLVENITDIDVVLTHSEAAALILEAALVKEHQPKYNIELKDSKSYPYIEISAGEFPRVSVIRFNKAEQKKKGAVYFGPYVDAGLIREALVIIRKIFPFCTCSPMPAKACLYQGIGLCPAPCVGAISGKDYARNIKNIALILSGRKDELYRNLKEDMERLAQNKDYEQAAAVRDQLQAIGALYSSSPDANYFKELEQLERALGLVRRPERMECIDISTTMGERSVGSLVSFLNGKPDKANYRRFRIKDVEGMDDFKMVAEVVRRRYGRLKREGAAYPDLVMIDGGKGQLAAAYDELKRLEINIPLISLAKREEEIFVPGKRNPVVLPKDSLALKLLQRVRDEAHRFAIKYHRLLRAGKVFD
ncbi:MAG: excinuclease ABC subunit UvrC [Candidatus Omnitrophica bacterium]|nr:excinuclease ABC subunit UvrC [Candidatus Omnitrophota bacterium]